MTTSSLNRSFHLLAFCLLALLPLSAKATTYTVSDLSDHSLDSLRYAISEAQNGDTIVFQSGLSGTITLTTTLPIYTGITIIGAGQITLSGGGSSSDFSVFTINGGTSSSPIVLTGLTIENGNAVNSNSGNGGGVYINSGDYVTLSNDILTGNSATNGGGICNDGGTESLTNCSLTGNSATYGGGIYNNGTDTLINDILSDNSAINGGQGGGVCNNDTESLSNCTLSGNSAPSGGGVFNGGTITLNNDILTGNSATSSSGEGGGILNNGLNESLTNCTLTGNIAHSGGGIFNFGSEDLTNCTVTGNSATYGGGIYLFGGADILTNSIFYSDTGGEILDNGKTSASYCDIGETLGSNGDGVTDNGSNIDTNPDFVSAPGNLHLQPGSPCIGAGAAQSEAPTGITIPTTDITGLMRPTPPSIGAYDVGVGSVLTATALTSSVNPSADGQSVTFTASVTENGAPVTTGTVIITVGGLSSPVFSLSSGPATVTTPALAPGSNSISAVYTPPTNSALAASASAPESQIVVYLTVSAPATASVGAPVQVTVSANPAAYTGPVTIASNDANATLPSGPITLSNGAATFSVTFNTLGGQTITATDDGNPANPSITATSRFVTVSAPATVTGVSTSWGKDTAALTAGASLLPAGRSVDVPWLGIKSFAVTLSAPETLIASDVSVTGIKIANYGPVAVSGSGSSYTITLAKPISAADVVTLALGNAGITSFTGSLPVLPGDVSDDGGVNARDLVLSRNMALFPADKTIFGDINGDGQENIADYILVRQRGSTKLP